MSTGAETAFASTGRGAVGDVHSVATATLTQTGSPTEYAAEATDERGDSARVDDPLGGSGRGVGADGESLGGDGDCRLAGDTELGPHAASAIARAGTTKLGGVLIWATERPIDAFPPRRRPR